MLGVPWTEFRTNESILQELGIGQRLSSIVRARILTFFGHVSRRGDVSVERLIVQGRIKGTRPRGRSPKQWTDQVRAALDGPLHECTRKAAIREEWQRIEAHHHLSTDDHDRSVKSVATKKKNLNILI